MDSVKSDVADALADAVLTPTGPIWLAQRILYFASSSAVFARLQGLHRAITSGAPGLLAEYGAASTWQLQVRYCYLTFGALGQFSVLTPADQLTVVRQICGVASREACLDGLESMFLTGLLTASAAGDHELFEKICAIWSEAGGRVVPGGYLPCTVVFSPVTSSFFAIDPGSLSSLTAVRDLRAIGDANVFFRNFAADFAAESAGLAAWVGKAAEWACRFGTSYVGSVAHGVTDEMLCADLGSSVQDAVASFGEDLDGDEKLLEKIAGRSGRPPLDSAPVPPRSSRPDGNDDGNPAGVVRGFTPVIASDTAPAAGGSKPTAGRRVTDDQASIGPVGVLSESGLLALRTEIGDEPSNDALERDGTLAIPTRTCLSGPGVRSLLYRVGRSWSVNGLPRLSGPSAAGDLGILRMFADVLPDEVTSLRPSAAQAQQADIADAPGGRGQEVSANRRLEISSAGAMLSAEEALRLIGEGMARWIMDA